MYWTNSKYLLVFLIELNALDMCSTNHREHISRGLNLILSLDFSLHFVQFGQKYHGLEFETNARAVFKVGIAPLDAV